METTTLTTIKYAAKHYLKTLGFTGTTREVSTLMDKNSGIKILEMAKSVGYGAKVLLLVAALSSCSKSELPLPDSQIVTYSVKCEDCLVSMQTSKWNASNELDRSKAQHFNVTGSFTSSFTNTNSLDTATAVVSVSVLYPRQQVVYINIWDNQGRSSRVIDTLGFYGDYRKVDRLEVAAKMALK